MVPRLKEKYNNEILPALKEKFGITNMMAAPRLEKIVINMGVGEAINDVKLIESAMKDLATITGQKPLMRRARIAISNFKLRQGMPVGCKVTLRRDKMYEFLDRLISISLPRIRDFNGLSRKSFDRFGNYSFGITDHVVFPEIESGRVAGQRGMDITFVFNKKPKEQTIELLSLLGMPFRRA